MIERIWFSVAEAAQYFGLKSSKTLYSLAARHQLPEGAVLRIGRQIRVNVKVIEAAAGINALRFENDKRKN
jgi:TolB-like protein